LVLDKGDLINVDLDTANSQEGAMLVQAYLYGV